jgi:hypothetical protein
LDWLDVDVSDDVVERACAHTSGELRHHSVRTAEFIEADVPDEVLSMYFSLCGEAGPIYQQSRTNETSADYEPAARANEASVLLNELEQLKSAYAAREQTLNEILQSKAFKLVSFYWRLRHRK